MKKYIGTKLINAVEMTKLAYNEAHNRNISGEDTEGYLVQYHDANGVFQDDGYFSWSPKDVFEVAYRSIDNMTFGLAIEALKQGKKVARAGWNGKDMYVELNKGGDYEFSELLPFFVLKGVNDAFNTWAASVSDTLAEDWVIIE
jgi:hypothetical protein